jgi:hypothetical protein
MSIATGPHFELAPATLARWLDERGADTWWSADGESFLASRLAFPSPTAAVVELLRGIDRPLLIRDRRGRPDSRGQPIAWEALDDQVERLGDSVYRTRPDVPEPEWASDRFFWLCWKDRPSEADEWMLVEDRETADAFRDGAASTTAQG